MKIYNSNFSNTISTLMIPDNIGNLKLPEPELVNFYNDLNNRIIWVVGDIDESILAYSRYIIEWNRQDNGIPIEERTPIRMYIFSPGGEVIPVLTLIDTILISKTPIYTYNMGMAYSAAGLLFMAGVKRYVLFYSKVMIHRLASGTEGSMKQLEDNLKQLKSIDETLRTLILKLTKISSVKYKKQQNNDWFIEAKECVELGIADKIIDDIDDIIQ